MSEAEPFLQERASWHRALSEKWHREHLEEQSCAELEDFIVDFVEAAQDLIEKDALMASGGVPAGFVNLAPDWPRRRKQILRAMVEGGTSWLEVSDAVGLWKKVSGRLSRSDLLSVVQQLGALTKSEWTVRNAVEPASFRRRHAQAADPDKNVPPRAR